MEDLREDKDNTTFILNNAFIKIDSCTAHRIFLLNNASYERQKYYPTKSLKRVDWSK